MQEAGRVTYNELLERLNDPWLTLVDVLPPESYVEMHILGAISLPFEEIRENGRNVLRDLNREVVVYCAGPPSTLSEQAVILLKELGYGNVRQFDQGLEGWKENGGPVEWRADTAITGVSSNKKKSIGFSPRLELIERSSFVTLLLVWLGMVVAFGLFYGTPAVFDGSGLKENGRLLGQTPSDIISAIYFSFVTATNMAFGDIMPVGPTRIWVVVETALALLLFGVIVAKLVSKRQEELIEKIHQIAFEDRLARVRTNLHFVLMELQQIEAECQNRAFSPERVMPRIESAIMVFVGELRLIHELLYRPQEIPLEPVMESIFASIAANLRQLRDLLDRSPEGSDPTDSFAALLFNAVLNPHLKAISRLVSGICSECVPRQYEGELKFWLEQLRTLAQF